MKLPRELDSVEARVLGCLLEKEQTTPDQYPLTVNALVAATNQRTNREPVMELGERDIRGALDRLHEEVMVWPVEGARTERWRHNLDRRWELDGGAKAVMTLLLLRGPQTPGELRGRSERLHPFDSPDEVEHVLLALTSEPEPLVVQLARRPGQKEARWAHLTCGEVADEPTADLRPPRAVTEPAGPSLRDRVEQLEARVHALERALRRLQD
jgi:hypothetical protein